VGKSVVWGAAILHGGVMTPLGS